MRAIERDRERRERQPCVSDVWQCSPRSKAAHISELKSCNIRQARIRGGGATGHVPPPQTSKKLA